jgi:hypothetical protein
MHSFHPSRARIFFDIFCALTIGTACAVAWLQTGASALLAISAVAAVYCLVHATDVPGRPRVAPQVAQAASEDQGDLLAYVPTEPKPVVEEMPEPAPKAKRKPRKKQPKAEIVAEPAIPESDEVGAFADVPEAVEAEEEHHAVVTPLFETQPLARQQRTVFGRKAS